MSYKGMDKDDLEREYRVVYWERNELELVLPDSSDPPYVQRLIEDKSEVLTKIETELGYVPAA